jgi:hypothetical protein
MPDPRKRPDLLALLRGAFAPDATAAPRPQFPTQQSGVAAREAATRMFPGTEPEPAELLTSPAADSLYRMVGVPSILGDLGPNGAAGVYVPFMSERYRKQFQDRFDNYGTAGPEDYPKVYRALQNKQSDYVGVGVGAGGVDYNPQRTPADDRAVLLHEGGHKYDQHIFKDLSKRGSEQRADVFAKVFDLLSKTGTSQDTAQWRERLKAIAGDYPVTGGIYKQNPLAQRGVRESSERATIADLIRQLKGRAASPEDNAMAMAREMLAHPSQVFYGHPLRKSFGLREQAPIPRTDRIIGLP